MSNELLSTVSADEVRRLAELLECGMGCGPTERRAATTLRALVLERDELAGRARGVEGELAVLEELQWQDKREDQLEAVGEPLSEMVNRFLRWKLPADFSPDCGISFKPESDYDHPEFGRAKYEPTGTNLLNYEQAQGMLRYVLYATPHTEAVRMSEAEILALWSGSEVATRPVLGSKKVIAFARAVEQATAARLGVQLGEKA